MNYNKRALESLYSNVRGDIPPRQHLVISEATVDELIDLLRRMSSEGLLNDKEISYIKTYLSRVPYEQGLVSYLKSKNLNEGTIDEGNVLKMIVRVLTKNEDLEAFSSYIKDTKSFSSLVERKGNLADDISSVSGLKRETAIDLINIKGTEGGRGVGKGEIAMATIFSDVKMSAGKGDLDWKGKYLEVKGTSARLGKRDRPFPSFYKTELGLLAKEYDKTDKRIDTLVANLANEPNIDTNRLLKALQTFIDDAYPNSNVTLTEFNLQDSKLVRNEITKVYALNYALHEGVDYFIFINTSQTRYFGRYFIFTKDEIPSFVERNLVKSAPITIVDLDPSIGTI